MYNAASSILDTLESIKAQSYQTIEIILINDGSSDSSLEIAKDFISRNMDVEIRLIDQKNRGVSAARNVGLKCATGEWIALIDSDDVWLNNKIERQLEVLNENPHIDFLATNRNGEFFRRFIFKKINLLTQIYPKDLLYKMFFITPTVIFRKDILADVGYFDESQNFCEDGNFFIRICQKKICYLLNESLVITGGGKAHFGESGLSGNLYKMQEGELANIKYALDNQIVSFFEFIIIYTFSMAKYLRRLLIAKKV